MKQGAQVQLTEQEEAICQLLDQTCAYIHREQPQLPEVDSTQRSGDGTQPCEARIAGGWVRDKLLTRDSDDLDIALSTLTGNAFALYLKDYLFSSSFASSPLSRSHFFSEENSEMGRIGKIAANPEQSKNLETATARVLGMSLDFVNLRKETYEPGSRIPTMTFGTPKEDAERRDITINSLLYNVHTRQVEDHTGLGLQDLAAGLIRTPLPPLTTFLDDPLRVLRCVRFSSRFAYELHPSIIRCLTGTSVAGTTIDDAQHSIEQLASSDDPRISAQGSAGVESGRDQIRDALISKVSRERFGIEVDKMIKGPHPLLALFLLHRLELFPLVFHPPPNAGKLALASSPAESGRPHPDSIALNAARLLDAILQGKTSEDAHPINPSVPMDGLRIGDVQTDAPRSDPSRAFSSIPPSPLPRAVFEALSSDLLSSWSSASLTPEERRRLWISVALLPLRHLIYEEKKNKYAWAGESVIANGLKLGTKTLKEPVASLHRCLELLPLGRRVLSHQQSGAESEALDKLLNLPPGLSVKSRLGLLLRSPHVTNGMLQLRPQPALLLSFISELVDLWQQHADFNHDTSSLAPLQSQALQLASEYGRFWQIIQQWSLLERAEEKALLDGHEVTACLGCHPRLISQVQVFVLAWQYDQVQLGEGAKEECERWLKGEWEKGGIVPVDQRPAPIAAKGDKGKKKKETGASGTAGKKEEGEERRKRQKSE